MRLINDDGVAPGLRVSDFVQDEGELLERRDDDLGLLTKQGPGQLVRILVDLDDHAFGVLELVNRVLELLVKHDPVSYHDDLVEDLAVGRIMQIRETMADPGNRVGFTRPRGVLDEVVLARASQLCVVFDFAHGIPLVEARKDHDGVLLPLRLRALSRDVDVYEARQDVKPSITLPDLLPEIRRAVSSRRWWVARPARITR